MCRNAYFKVLALAAVYFLLPLYVFWLALVYNLVTALISYDQPVKDPKRWSVVIVGAGASGLCMAKRLLDVGIENFVVLEKAKSAGGTWRQNVYPGVSTCVPAHLYTFSFFPYPWLDFLQTY